MTAPQLQAIRETDTKAVDRVQQLLDELRRVREEKHAQYWAFTRCARGTPVDPALCRREVELEAELRQARTVAP